MREFLRIWDGLENKQSLSIEAIGNAVNTWNINELVRDAVGVTLPCYPVLTTIHQRRSRAKI